MADDEIGDLQAHVAALDVVFAELGALIHRLDPDGFEYVVRRQRMLVQATALGTFPPVEPQAQRAQLLVRDLLERAIARNRDAEPPSD